jgi:hypothetical protein
MGRLDSAQFLHLGRIPLGSHEVNIPRPTSKGLQKVVGKLWYVPAGRKVLLKMRAVISSTHNGKGVSVSIQGSWPGGGDRTHLKAHLEAMTKKYYKKIRSGEWPASGSYLTHCNKPWADNFVVDTCTGCKASYCTVER